MAEVSRKGIKRESRDLMLEYHAVVIAEEAGQRLYLPGVQVRMCMPESICKLSLGGRAIVLCADSCVLPLSTNPYSPIVMIKSCSLPSRKSWSMTGSDPNLP